VYVGKHHHNFENKWSKANVFLKNAA